MNDTIDIIKYRIDHDKLTEEYRTKWRNWKWQLKHTIKTVETVEKVLGVKFSEEDKIRYQRIMDKFPMAITPYYLSLVHSEDYKNDPVFKQAFPDENELIISDYDMEDPLHEDKDSPVKGITHRYPDRVLFLVSNSCAMYCRHCTRKRKVGDIDSIPTREEMKIGLDYIRRTPVIRDVLLSGGDPLLLSDDMIAWLLDELSQIPHVEVVRIGSRIPVVLPYRITYELIEIFKKHTNLWFNTQFNHPKEITSASRRCLKKLSEAGIPLGNQSVLLRNINDCPRVMKSLVHKLVANRVRPYYIYQCDMSEGLEHFRTNVGMGIEIMESLRGHTSGFAVPTYVIDAPGGGGKIPVMPNYIVSWSTNKIILRNYEGTITTYNMPTNYTPHNCHLDCQDCNLTLNLEGKDEEDYNTIGIAKLLSDRDDMYALVPEELERNRRNNGDS